MWSEESPPFLDQASADAAEEVFAVGFGLGQDFGLVAVFERDFLQEKVDGIFGFETLRDQLADARGEAVRVIGGPEAGKVVGTFVIAKFARCQAVERGLGFRIVEKSGKRGIPFALGAGPSMEGMVGRPDQFSGGFLLWGATFCRAIHELVPIPALARPMGNPFGILQPICWHGESYRYRGRFAVEMESQKQWAETHSTYLAKK